VKGALRPFITYFSATILFHLFGFYAGLIHLVPFKTVLFSEVSVTSTSTLKLYRASARQRLGLGSLVTNILQPMCQESDNKCRGDYFLYF